GDVAADKFLAVAVGSLLVAAVLVSALRTVVLPQGGQTGITRFVFAVANRVFTGANTRRILPRHLSGLYAPVALVSLPFAWCMLIAVGFSFVFWGFDIGSFSDAWVTSGSSLFTLGFAKPEGGGLIWLTFVEATIGLGVVALLISFLPTLYAAYSAREQGVGMLAPLAGSPASATQLLWRLHAAHSLAGAGTWSSTSAWFVAVEQSHIAFPALSQFPPQQEDRSWVATAGSVLDAAAIAISVAEIEKGQPVDAAADAGGERPHVGGLLLVLTHGSSAIVGTARASGIDVEDPPALVDLVLGTDHDARPISVERREYDEAVEFLAKAGVVGAVDTERGWVIFSRIRASYDTALRGLAGLTHAPPAPWTSDRALIVGRPRFFSHKSLDTREP
ncbi:MAG TPA: hypothetical protein VIT24_05560, partial [Acidimicrobiales bacterium]